MINYFWIKCGATLKGGIWSPLSIPYYSSLTLPYRCSLSDTTLDTMVLHSSLLVAISAHLFMFIPAYRVTFHSFIIHSLLFKPYLTLPLFLVGHDVGYYGPPFFPVGSNFCASVYVHSCISGDVSQPSASLPSSTAFAIYHAFSHAHRT